MPRLVDMPGSARLVAGLFALAVLAFALLAQVNLWVQDGGGDLPTPDEVLWKYHGRPNSSRFDTVLDLELPYDRRNAMWPYLEVGADSPTKLVRERQKTILDWVHAGAPADGWATVEPIFTGSDYCGQCHYVGGEKSDAPFSTYDDVLPFTRPDTGMPKQQLLITAHNHLFGFTVLALLLSVGVCLTRVRGFARAALILGVFAGPALDIGGWLLTSGYGAPFHWFVLVGGGLFGAASAAMALLILVDSLRIGAK